MTSHAELATAPASLLQSVWKTGLWKCFPVLILYSMGLATLIPILPGLITDGFASQAAGHILHCQDYSPDEAPRECHDAHAQAVVWASWASFVSGAILSFTFSPIIGSLSDEYGRKPFMLLGLGLGFGPMLMTMLNVWGWLPIQWYFAAYALSGLASSLTMLLTVVVDLMHHSHYQYSWNPNMLHRYFAAYALLGIASSLTMLLTVVVDLMHHSHYQYSCNPNMLHMYFAAYALLGIASSLTMLLTVVVDLMHHSHYQYSCNPNMLHRYFAAYALSGLASSLTMLLTVVADLMHHSHRTVSLAIFIGMFNIGIICGPILGAFLSPINAVYVCVSLTVCTFMYVAFVLPESAPKVIKRRLRNSKQLPGSFPPSCLDGCDYGAQHGSYQPPSLEGAAPKVEGTTPFAGAAGTTEGAVGKDPQSSPSLVFPTSHDQHGEHFEGGGTGSITHKSDVVTDEYEAAAKKLQETADDELSVLDSVSRSILTGWRILYRSAWYRKLAMIWVVVAINQMAFQELLFQYLQLTMGFKTVDQASVLVTLSVTSLLVKFCFIAMLVRRLGEQWLLVLGLAAYVAEEVLLGLATSRAQVFGALCVGGLSNVAWPALLTLQASGVSAQQQGAISGVMQAISSLASGIGPLGFAYLFSATTSLDKSIFPYMPELVWFVAAGMVMIAILISSTLHWGTGGGEKVDGCEEELSEKRPVRAMSYAIRSWSMRGVLARMGSYNKGSTPTTVDENDVEGNIIDVNEPLLSNASDGGIGS
eukprot:gene15593-21697_t